jgi:hypothetical protein
MVIGVACVVPPVGASDFSNGARQPVLNLQLGLQFGHRGQVDISINGVPLRTDAKSMNMSCPPPPDSCTPMVAAMSAATAASLVFLYALSRNRDR